MTKLTAAMVLEKVAEEQLEYHGKKLCDDEGTTLITEIVGGESAYIYIDLHAYWNDEDGGYSPIYRLYEITDEGMQFDDSYETAQEAIENFEKIVATYSGVKSVSCN